MTTARILDSRAAGGRRFEGKVAVVAGSGQGIGRATARRFAQEGAKVVLGDFVEETANKVRNEIREFGGEAEVYVGDFSVLKQAEGLMALALKSYGRIDALANIVGGTIWFRSYRYYDPEQVMAEVNKSLWPSMWLCHAVLPSMIEQRSGAIVNLATHAIASRFRVPYAASKGGVIGLTMSLSKEVAEYGIRVNCIAPHSTEADDRVTPRNHGVAIDPSPVPQSEAEALERFRDGWITREIPLNRNARPEEQAAVIAFLASEDASYVTGQVLAVGGGATFPM